MSNYIPSDLYEKMVESIPIVCVDVLIHNYNTGKYLLVKRKDEPLKGEWCVIGGRLYKNEKTEDCAIRKAKEEVGLNCTIGRFLGVANTMFSTGYHNIPVHSVNLIYLLGYDGKTKVKIDDTCIDYKWIVNSKKLKLNPYVKGCLNLL